MKIGENIRAIREKKSLTQAVIAEALGLDGAVVSNIETGKREVKISELEIISNCLGVSLIDLVTYPDKYAKVTSERESEPVEAILQIRLTEKKRDQVLNIVLGQKGVELIKD